MSNDVASSVLVDGHLYGFDLRDVQTKGRRPSRGSFRCIELLTGNLEWSNGNPQKRRNPSDPKVIGHTSVIFADGKLIMLNDSGDLILARATPDQYEQLGRVNVFADEICWTAPALHRGCVFLRDQKRAVCIYIGQSDLLDSHVAAAALTAEEAAQVVSSSPAEILGIGQEHAYRKPSASEFRHWYAYCLGLLIIAILCASCLCLAFRRRGMRWATAQWFLWSSAFLLGALGTTILATWHGEFIFTWPLSLFAVFQPTLRQLQLSRHSTAPIPNGRLQSRTAGLLFVAVVIGYFLTCQRLGLVAQWFFLTGFVAVVPIEFVRRRFMDTSTDHPWLEGSYLVISFSAYYWASVAILLLNRGSF
jgi:hypothetical protein